MAVNDLVKKAVDQINEKAQASTEQQVNNLVHSIIDSESQIARLQQQVAEAKKKLKELEMPKPVSVDL